MRTLTKTIGRTHKLGLLKEILKQMEEIQLKIYDILYKYAVIFYGKAKIRSTHIVAGHYEAG
jgi:hypothetical protein